VDNTIYWKKRNDFLNNPIYENHAIGFVWGSGIDKKKVANMVIHRDYKSLETTKAVIIENHIISLEDTRLYRMRRIYLTPCDYEEGWVRFPPSLLSNEPHSGRKDKQIDY